MSEPSTASSWAGTKTSALSGSAIAWPGTNPGSFTADLFVSTQAHTRSLHLKTDGQGHWFDGEDHALPALQGCRDIDIWPTPFTNSFPIRRVALAVGERREFLMAWVDGLAMTVRPQPQAYTRLQDRLYLFESLDGSGFQAELPVDEHGIVLDYPGLFRREPAPAV